MTGNMLNLKKLLLMIVMIWVTNFTHAAVYCRIQPEIARPDSVYFVGDTVRFEVNIENSSNVDFTGIRVYLTINPKYLKPVFHNGQPFIDAQFISTPPKENNTHGDEWGDPMANGIRGFQLDYYQSTGPRNADGYRPRVSGSGTVAYLDLVLVGIPNENVDYFMKFDNDNYHNRKSGYYELDNPGKTIEYSNSTVPFFNIVGASIQPPLENTLLIPGKDISKYLGDHFYCKAYEDDEAVWSYKTIMNEPSGIFSIDTTNNNDMLKYLTATTAKGIFKVKLEVGIQGTDFYDSQIWKVHVDHPPKYSDPLPEISLKEDESFRIDRKAIVTDKDDPAETLQIYKDTLDSSINLIYDDNADELIFIPKSNWNGTKDIQIFADDGLIFTPVDTTININVESVNDLPVVNFSGIDSRGDTLVLYHMYDDTLSLAEYTNDVDHEISELEWQVNKMGNNSDKISSNFHTRDTVIFSVNEEGFYGTVPVEISAEDNEGGIGKDTVIVDVRSFPPTFQNLPTIAMHSDSLKRVDLSQYLIDLDTPLEDISITPTIINKKTGSVHDSVDVSYDQTSQELIIDVPNQYNGHNLDGVLSLKAKDDDNNTTTDETDLIIVNVSPKIFNIAPVHVFPDTTMDVLDLSEYVFDIYESSEKINWEIINIPEFDLIQNATINETVLEVTSGTELGQDTIEVVATNSKGGTDSTEIVVVIAPQDPSPVIFNLPNKNVLWKDSVSYVDLDNYVFDVVTPDSAIEWNVTGFDESFLEVKINDETREVSLITKSLVGNTSISFTATDEDNNSSTKDANIMIQKDSGPSWNFGDMKYIYMSYSQYQRELDFALSEKCSDDQTASRELKYKARYSKEIKNVTIDPQTTAPTLTLDTTAASDEGWIVFQAEDEQGNVSTSDTLAVIIRETLPPKWAHLPDPIRMNNDETVELELYDYLTDHDNKNSDLTFSYNVYSDQNEVQKDVVLNFDQGTATIKIEKGFSGNVKLILIVTDPDGNEAKASSRLIISDRVPPQVALEYFQNPISARRVKFIITSDYSSILDFETSFYKDGNYVPLSFEQLDNQDGHKIWEGEYKFQESTNYQLITEIEDRNYNKAIDTLNITSAIPKVSGGLVSMFDKRITVEYPEYQFDDKQFFMLTNHVQNNIGNSLAKESEKAKIYKFNTSVKNTNISTIVYYNPKQKLDKYNSFYKIVEGNQIPVETYLQSDGRFMAFMEPNVEFLFKESDIAAEVQTIPENSFLTYPNPFNSSVNIKFMLKKKGNVDMQIYNLLGQRVYSVKRTFNPGINKINWNGKSSTGKSLSSGIYFIVVRKNSNKLKVKKVTYFK